VVQVIAMAQALRRGTLPPIAGLAPASFLAQAPLRPLASCEPTAARAALLLSVGAPGLAGAVRVQVP
jgi:hypothetical protein